MMRKLVREKKAENLGHFNPTIAYATNEWAGHDPSSPRPKLVALKPHNVERPPPVGEGEIVVQVCELCREHGGGVAPW